MALNAPELLLDLTRRYPKQDLRQVLADLVKLVPVYLVCTDQGYPFGGGESFMLQTCRIMNEFGFRCVWVSFADKHLRPHPASAIISTPCYLDVREAGGMTQEHVESAIQKWMPDIVHSQGAANELVAKASMRCRVPALVGYHFWTGLIHLGKSRNRRIIQNLAEHSPAAVSDTEKSNFVTRYVASEFMADVYQKVGGRLPLPIYHPVSDPADYQTNQSRLGEFVLQINIAATKGGEILLKCISDLGSRIPFIAVQTEPQSEDLDQKIKAAVGKTPRSVYAEYAPVKDYYSRARLVIIPTLVDETFCRVAYEAAMNGIPVLCTRNGFLPYMFGDSGVYLPEDANVWSETIESLYFDLDRLRQIGAAQRAYVQRLYGHIPERFIAAVLQAAALSPKRNVGFFTAWAEQGLGQQARHYARLLRRAGYRIHVFSFQPYSVAGTALAAQYDPNDWSTPAHADSVHYSFNDREHVTGYELEQFVRANNVGTLVCPEICWEPNWSRLESLAVENLSICCVPNIETVRSEEVLRHNSLQTTWYNTNIAARTLNEAGVRNGLYVGHGFGEVRPAAFTDSKIERLRSRGFIEFLHISGYNPVQRKQTHLVVKAFAEVAKQQTDIHLTVTVMRSARELQRAVNTPNITFIDKDLNHAQILELYEQSDVSIQVSSHEGLGLGFYESISRGTPVISLDIPPHNEVILDEQTGWLIKARSEPVPDNSGALVYAGALDVRDLARVLANLSRSEIERVMRRTSRVFSERFDELPFLLRLVRALPNGAVANKMRHSARPLTCQLQQPGPIFAIARATARAVLPKAKPGWLRPVAPLVGRIDRWFVWLGVSMFRPSCCREYAARRQHCPHRVRAR